MTENQIKGCQLLAEVEGLRMYQVETPFGLKWMVNRNSGACGCYLTDWNDLHRVATLIEPKIARETGSDWVNYMIALSDAFQSHDKLKTFNALVEAAEWIKQNQK